MTKYNEISLDQKIHTYMDNLSTYFDSISTNSENYNVLNESIFNFNPTGDIAITLHTCHANNIFHKHDFFEMIYVYSEENFSTTNLQETAMHFHYHPNYLSKEIKKYTNKTYSEILQNTKLKQSCFYLSKTNLSVQEIIEKVGYSELSHFYHIFKKNFGITPSEYRK